MIAVGRYGIGRDPGSRKQRKRLGRRWRWAIAVPGGTMRAWTFGNLYLIRMPNHDGVRFLRYHRVKRVG